MTTRVRYPRKRHTPPLAFNGPRGICECGHSGNGPDSDHADDNLRTSDTVQGTGVCHALGCQCSRFIMHHRTPDFATYCKDVATVRTLTEHRLP